MPSQQGNSHLDNFSTLLKLHSEEQPYVDPEASRPPPYPDLDDWDGRPTGDDWDGGPT